ncbi:hypothetical protein GCM10023335_67500 [Streptomyces siamensis]|uniref:Uncharacterized protein n=1 Tax=Streptomyces siamensis TaxID=1274986 RepID=A0ABP9JEL1_9ACTN
MMFPLSFARIPKALVELDTFANSRLAPGYGRSMTERQGRVPCILGACRAESPRLARWPVDAFGRFTGTEYGPHWPSRGTGIWPALVPAIADATAPARHPTITRPCPAEAQPVPRSTAERVAWTD